MATVISTVPYPLTLTDGHTVAQGDAPYNVDTTQRIEAAFIASGRLKVVDVNASPPAPADPSAARPRAVYLAPSQPAGMPVGSIWRKTDSADPPNIIAEYIVTAD